MGGGGGGDGIYVQVVHLIRLVQAIHLVLLIPVKRPKTFLTVTFKKKNDTIKFCKNAKNDCSNVITLRNINNVLHCTVDKEHFLLAEVCIKNISIETASTKKCFHKIF